MRRWAVISLFLLTVATACADADDDSAIGADSSDGGTAAVGDENESAAVTSIVEAAPEPTVDERVVGRTNVQPSGNRTLPGSLDLSTQPTTVDLPFTAVWVVPIEDGRTAVVGTDGSAAIVDGDTISELGSVDPRVRPLAIESGDGLRLVPANSGVESDLPDATEVEADGIRAWFDGATERVPHGALGDTIESLRLVIVRPVVDDAASAEVTEQQERIVVDLEDAPGGPVFEGLSPLLADIDGDGEIDIITTISDGRVGATLVVFDSDGNRIAESRSIGRANRWRHQLAAAPTGPDGAIEIVEVQTPHLSADLQFQSFDGEQLVLRRSEAGYRSHVLGSRNMDGAVVFDADADGEVEVVVPVRDLATLVAVEPSADASDDLSIDLGGATVSSNLALGMTERGLRFAVALSDGRLLLWAN